ncbi:hypothetical protein LCGC14_1117240 [marine sediment metagenome]|uniref:Uncharacterized protein n=1 Tax=marine sediment metagenome TaxID=412755 RepID=A0A0F9M4Y0_9ZZZZ
MDTPRVYDILCSIGELIDKLSIENIKCYDANQKVIAERKQLSPRAESIASWEWQARRSGEQRVALRDEINRRINEAIKRGSITVSKEARTYDLEEIS